MSTMRLPETDSIEELAQFWDSHDLTDFEDELEEVPEPVFGADTTIAVHLPSNDVEMLREIANSRGMADAELIRSWVLEKLHSG